MRIANRRDKPHAAIVKAYEDLGCTVVDLSRVGNGCPDLLVGLVGVSQLVEVKSPGEDLRPNQRAFSANWRGGKIHIIHSVDEARDHVAKIRASARLAHGKIAWREYETRSSAH